MSNPLPPKTPSETPDGSVPRPGNPLVFNYEDLLRRSCGAESVIPEIVTAFIRNLPRQISQMREFHRTGLVSKLQGLTHSLKGSAATLGAEQMSADALSLEKALKAGETEAIDDHLLQIEKDFAALEKEMIQRKILIQEG